MRLIVTILVVMIITVIVFVVKLLAEMTNIPLWISFWGSLILGVVLIFYFFYSALRKITTDPPHKAILVFLGKRQEKALSEGWHFFPLYPIVFDVISINVTKVNQDLPEQVVKTPDFADLGFDISITWTPGSWKKSNKEQAELLITYLNSGKEEGVRNILKDIIQDRLRMWAFSKEEGPTDWEEAVGARDEAIAILIKAILGNGLCKIPSPVPTNVLLRYFNLPPKKPLLCQEKRWGKQTKGGSEWEGLKKELEAIPTQELADLKKAVGERKDIITEVKQGSGKFVKESLGITINRFTINEVVLKGKVAEAVESRVVEEHERKAETIELKHVRQRAKALAKEGLFTPEQSIEIIQTERKKITKTINETKLNISPETRGMIERLIQGFAK